MYLVLDKDLRVVTANRSFQLTFMTSRQEVRGLPIHVLGDGQWGLRVCDDGIGEARTRRVERSLRFLALAGVVRRSGSGCLSLMIGGTVMNSCSHQSWLNGSIIPLFAVSTHETDWVG
jgi:hypothetical protein